MRKSRLAVLLKRIRKASKEVGDSASKCGANVALAFLLAMWTSFAVGVHLFRHGGQLLVEYHGKVFVNISVEVELFWPEYLMIHTPIMWIKVHEECRILSVTEAQQHGQQRV